MFSYFDQVKNEKDVKIVKQFRQNIIQNELETDLTQIVEIDNFPNDLDCDLAKIIAIREGVVGLLKKNDEYYICSVTPVGLPRKDGRPYKVIARYLAMGKTGYEVKVEEYENDKDIVLWYNTDFATPDYNPLRYAHILAEVDVSILANVKRSRLNPLIRVKNSIEKNQIDEALTKSDIDYGTPTTYISDNTLSDLISKETPEDYILNFTNVNDSDKIQFLSNLNLDLRNRFYSKYGLTMNSSNGKMAQQTTAEIKGADASSWLIPMDMLKQAKKFCERCKDVFGLEMVAHFGAIHELNYKSFSNDCTEDNTATEDICNDLEERENVNEDNIGNLQDKETE